MNNINFYFSSLIKVSFCSVLSRMLGFLRDTIVTCRFGISSINDAFIVSTRLISMCKGVFVEGGLKIVLIPILVKTYNESVTKYYDFINVIHVLIVLFLFIFLTDVSYCQ